MSARRRIRRFAAPLVIVAAAPGCKKPAEESTRPRASDAGVAAAKADAGAATLDHLVFFDSASGGCMTYPERRAVDCAGNPTVVFAWKTITKPDGAYRFDTGSMTCSLQPPSSCAPDTKCNPPPPQPVACPPELMPTLTGGATMTRRDDTGCYWHDLAILCPGAIVFDDPSCYQADATGQRAFVDCPSALLPPAPTDDLVYAQGPMCFPVHASGGQGRVTCPPGGATVILPSPTSKDLGGRRHVAFLTDRMSCQEWADMDCPQGATCNPPPPTPVECPPELLPRLANGATPTATKDGKCTWNAYQVACP